MRTETEIRKEIEKEKKIFDTAVITKNYHIATIQVKKIIELTKELYKVKTKVSNSDKKGLEILQKLLKKLENKSKTIKNKNKNTQ